MNGTEWITRVRRMEPAEIWFRARVAARAHAGRLASSVRTEGWQRDRLAGRLVHQAGCLETARERLGARDWAGAHTALSRHFHTRQSRFPLSPDMLPALAERIRAQFPGSVEDSRIRAERVMNGTFDLLGYRGLSFVSDARGRHAIDWHYDPVHRRRSASGFWSSVPYLDPRNGDHKIIWELNRHQHWLVLGRAVWLTEDPRYRTEFVRQLEDWLQQNPPLAGINWASPLELSLRCLSWLWALHLFVEAPGAETDRRGSPWVVDLLLGLDRQLSQVERNLSRYFSPNTHLTGEALGLYVCGCALPELTGAPDWVRTGREVLLEQIDRQICADGGHAERSTHYHRYSLDFYMLALTVARLTGDACAGQLADAVARLARAGRLLAADEGRLPLIGDDDGGMLFPMCGSEPSNIGNSLATAAVLLQDPALASGRTPAEEPWWMLGADAAARRMPRADGDDCLPASGALPDTGYYVSRRRPGDHIVIDGGPHGHLNGGHAHADALAVTVTLAGQPLFIDPGTATYTMSAEVRDRFRSTAMHNTLMVDGRSQSEPRGPFHWSRSADATVERWITSAPFDYFEGTHNGYLPLVHRRRLVVLEDGVIVVVDSVAGDGVHDLAVHWHAAPGWAAEAGPRRTLLLHHPSGHSVRLITSAALIELFEGDDNPRLGWSSPAFGCVIPSPTVRASVTRRLPATIVTVIAEGRWPNTSVTEAEVLDAGPGADAIAVRLAGPHADRLLLFGGLDASGKRRAEAGGFASDGRLALVERNAGGKAGRVALLDGDSVSTGND